jgi:DNA-binding transcriptional MerR regulator
MAAELTISETSKQYDVTCRTLRYYEDEGLISPRRESGQRLYDEEVRKRIKMIILGKKLGFSLLEIKEIVKDANVRESVDFEQLLSKQQMLEQIEYLEQKREAADRAIAKLRAHLGRSQEGLT